MIRKIAASLLSAAVASAPIPTGAAPASESIDPPPAVTPDWAGEAAPREKIVAQVVKDTVADIRAAEDEENSATRYDTYNVYRHRQNGQQKFEHMFADSKVPGCLRPDGLKRQPTFIFGGLLALPFIAVAALRGKCN